MGTEHLGRAIRSLRKARKLSLKQLSERISDKAPTLDPSCLSRIETGKRRLVADEADIIARALGVPVADLYGDGQDLPPAA